MPEPRTESLRVRGLAKRYGPVEAVRGVSFDVAEGEIFGLLGPNGAGKTSILECVLGLRHPDSGSVAIGGIDAVGRPELAKEGVGAQIQRASLQDKITPRQALGFFASFYREPAPVGELIGRFGLAARADAPFDSLSGGQRQRLFLALAFVNNPRLVVLDEPTAGLDPQARRELRGLIGAMRADGLAVLMSTHDLQEAHALCDRIGILNEGRIVAIGSPAELISRSGAVARVCVRTARATGLPQAPALPGVVSSTAEGDTWLLATEDVGRTVTALMSQLELEENALLDLQVRGPSLEDVFLELTGRPWPDAPGGGGA
ncbi:MAG TPA: ABC transporter ATP-binding protein [Opitutaceae bacterium]|nr:ABC transporter ATP-binding protein [Opitutaceae bacterium]